MIRVATRTDDAGSFKSANRAIRAAFKEGVAKNAGLMAPCAHIADARDVFADCEGLCLGMHLTLTAEWDDPRWGPLLPPAEVSSFVMEDGTLHKTTPAFSEVEPQVDQILAEARAQLNKLRSFGFELRYLDEHMGVGWREDVGDALRDFAEKENLVFRPDFDDRIMQGEGDPADRFLNGLKNASDGTYLVVGHPCYDEDETAAVERSGEKDFLGRERDKERLLFMREDVVAYFREHASTVEAIRYDEI